MIIFKSSPKNLLVLILLIVFFGCLAAWKIYIDIRAGDFGFGSLNLVFIIFIVLSFENSTLTQDGNTLIVKRFLRPLLKVSLGDIMALAIEKKKLALLYSDKKGRQHIIDFRLYFYNKGQIAALNERIKGIIKVP